MDLNSVATLFFVGLFVLAVSFAIGYRSRMVSAEADNLDLRRGVERFKSLSLPTPKWANCHGIGGVWQCQSVVRNAAEHPYLESYDDYFARVLSKATLIARREHAKATEEFYR